MRHFQEHAGAVLEGINPKSSERDALVEELAVLAELVSLTGERSQAMRATQSQKKSVRRIRKAGAAYFHAIDQADDETKERLLQYLGKFADGSAKSAENDDVDAIRASGWKAYLSALETIARIRHFAKRSADGRGPKATPFLEVVMALAAMWERHTGQAIVNTTKTPHSGFPGFVTRFMKAAHAIAEAKGRAVWRPDKRGMRYDEATALRNIVEEVRVIRASTAKA